MLLLFKLINWIMHTLTVTVKPFSLLATVQSQPRNPPSQPWNRSGQKGPRLKRNSSILIPEERSICGSGTDRARVSLPTGPRVVTNEI